MDAGFLASFLSFPAIVFSVLLGVVLLYWLAVIIGMLDLDFISDSPLEDTFDAAGCAGVPVTIVISLLVLSGWLLVMPLTHYLVMPLPTLALRLVVGTAVLVGGGLAAMWLTVYLVKPFRHLFNSHEVHGGARLLGKLCVITTSSVGPDFGQAEYDDKGAGLLLNVHADEPNPLRRGSRALLISYDETDNSYVVSLYED